MPPTAPDPVPVEATRAVLAHIERWEPSLKATYALDPEGALAAARESEARWMKASRCRPAASANHQENIATRGVPVPLGTAATDPASADAPPAARMREAGAVVLGRPPCRTTACCRPACPASTN